MRGRRPGARRATRRRASAATARSPMRSPSPAPPKRRSALEAPPRADWLRGADGRAGARSPTISATSARSATTPSFALMHAHCGVLRERVLRAADGRLRPPADDGLRRARRRRRRPRPRRRDDDPRRWSRRSAQRFPGWSSSTTTPPRCRTAPSAPASLEAELARAFGAGGYVGRASGRDFDARRDSAYPPYDELRLRRSDARRGRRQRARLDALSRGRAEPRLIDQMLDRLPDGADPRRAAGAGARRGLGAGRGFPRRHLRPRARWTATAGSRAAICAIRRGSSGRCSRRRSRATSSPTSRSATNRSTAPIPGYDL